MSLIWSKRPTAMLSLAAQLHLSGSNCSGGHPQSSAGVDDGVGGGVKALLLSDHQLSIYLVAD